MASTPEFAAPRAPSQWRRKLTSFWRWWTGELARLLPERLSMFRGGTRAPMVALEGDDLVVVEAHGAAPANPARVSLASLDEPGRRAALRSLLEAAGETRGQVRLALDHSEALVRRVPMPEATEENLSQVLGFEMDRLTPFKADEVYYDYRVLSRDPAKAQIVIQLAVARRELVDARIEALRSLGASVQGVALRDDAGAAAPSMDLLPSTQRGVRGSNRERLVRRVLLGVVALLFLAALVVPIWQKRTTFLALSPVMLKAKQEAEATDAVARDLEKQVADYNFLLAKKHGTFSSLAFLEEMSRLLPDSTWVQQLDIKTVGKVRELQITGETASSSKLIEILEQSTLLQNAAPRGTVTRGSQPGTERFMIAAETRARAQPEARPVLEAIPATAPSAAAPAVAPPVAAPPVAAPPAPPAAGVAKVAPAKPAGK